VLSDLEGRCGGFGLLDGDRVGQRPKRAGAAPRLDTTLRRALPRMGRVAPAATQIALTEANE